MSIIETFLNFFVLWILMTGFDKNEQNQTANDQLDHFAPTEEVTVLYVIIYTNAQCVHIRNFISFRFKKTKLPNQNCELFSFHFEQCVHWSDYVSVFETFFSRKQLWPIWKESKLFSQKVGYNEFDNFWGFITNF